MAPKGITPVQKVRFQREGRLEILATSMMLMRSYDVDATFMLKIDLDPWTCPVADAVTASFDYG